MKFNEDYMIRAIELAKKGRGYVSPNPIVGSVVVKDNMIIGEGYHEKYGKEHAEVNALKNCSESPIDADLYVTLEPCFHSYINAIRKMFISSKYFHFVLWLSKKLRL